MKEINLNEIINNLNIEQCEFKIDPLDINIAKIQFNLQKRLPAEISEADNYSTIIEKYVSKDPTLNIKSIEIKCNKSDVKNSNTLEIIILNKNKNEYKCIIAKGDKKNINSIIKEKDFFRLCKTIALYVNNLV